MSLRLIDDSFQVAASILWFYRNISKPADVLFVLLSWLCDVGLGFICI